MDPSKAPLTPPLSHFWIVEWADGHAIMQFDPTTGYEHLFSEVIKRNKLIRRAAWMPFPGPLAAKITQQRTLQLPVETLIGMEIPPDAKLLLRKRVFMPIGIGDTTQRIPFAVHLVGYRRGVQQVLIGVDSFGRRVRDEALSKIGWSIKGIGIKGELDATSI